jgi:AcrR family transcriptional regulator
MQDEPRLKDELIRKAVEIFSLKGYAAANLTDITDALRVSRGPVYYHFKDKYGLYEAAYELWEKELRENNERIYAQPYPGILKLLEQTVYNCLDLYKRYHATFFAGIETISELADLKTRFLRVTSEVYEMKLVAVKRAIANREIRSDIAPELIVQMIYILYDGIRIGWERPELPLKEADIRQIIAIHMEGLERTCCV